MTAISARSAGPAPPSACVPFEAVAAMDRATFARQFGAVFEAAPWVAEAAWPARPVRRHRVPPPGDGLGRAARRPAIVASPLIRAHPDLAGHDSLSADLAREQDAAGLAGLTAADRAELLELNAAYRARFGFPFVICARQHTAAGLIAAARARVGADAACEERRALDEVMKVARLRLWSLVE